MAAMDIDGILGLHVECTDISSPRRDTHFLESIRPFDQSTFAVVERLSSKNIIALITLAPAVGKADNIRTLNYVSVVVSISQSSPNFKKTKKQFNGVLSFYIFFKCYAASLKPRPSHCDGGDKFAILH